MPQGCYPNSKGIGGLGASVFASNPQYEVQRNNHFEVSLTYIPGNDNQFPQEFRVAVSEVSFPEWSVSDLTLYMGNQSVKVSGQPELGDASITLNDYIGIDLENRLYRWWRCVYNPETGLMGLAIDYKTNMKLIMYAPDGSMERSWDCYGVWPTAAPAGSFSYEGSDKRTIDLTLKVDNMYPDLDVRSTIREEAAAIRNNYISGSRRWPDSIG